MKNSIYRQYMYSYPHKTAYRKLKQGDIELYLKKIEGEASGLYIHIPFCGSKCGYCNLFSVAMPEEGYCDDYLSALERQFRQYSHMIDMKNIRFDSMTFGGGTPTLLNIRQLGQLFSMVHRYTGVDPANLLSSIETSPNQIDDDKLSFLKSCGVKRISIGVQSFIEGELESLRRACDVPKAISALTGIKLHNFEQLNIDLIYGIIGQTKESLAYSLDTAIAFEPDEIFAYPLYIKPFTPLYGSRALDDYTKYEYYSFVSEYLQQKGYNQVSMRRFVKGLAHCANNLECGFENNLAFGCGGRTYIENLHFCEPYGVLRGDCLSTINNYMAKSDFLASLNGYILNDDETQRRFIIKNLLFYKGIAFSRYREIFGTSITDDFPIMNELLESGYAISDGGDIRLTPLGLSLSDSIGAMFISDTVSLRMNDYYGG